MQHFIAYVYFRRICRMVVFLNGIRFCFDYLIILYCGYQIQILNQTGSNQLHLLFLNMRLQRNSLTKFNEMLRYCLTWLNLPSRLFLHTHKRFALVFSRRETTFEASYCVDFFHYNHLFSGLDYNGSHIHAPLFSRRLFLRDRVTYLKHIDHASSQSWLYSCSCSSGGVFLSHL